MSVILFILKIIGICAAVLVGVFVLLLTFILVSRIRYCAALEKKDKLTAVCDIKWLLGIIKIKASYDENGPEIFVYIFGRKFYPKASKVKEKVEAVDIDINDKEASGVSLKKDDRSESLKKFDEEVQREFKQQAQIAIASNDEIKTEVKKQETKEPIRRKTIKIETGEPVIKRIKIKDIKVENIEIKNEIKEPKKIENSEKTEKTPKPEEKDIKDYIMDMPWDDKKTVLSALFKALKRFKAILPKTIYINGKAGLGSPDYTGLLLAFGGILNGMINGECRLSGDFDAMYFYGDIKAKGRFTAGYLLFTAIQLILVKPVRKLGLYILRN